MDKAMFEPKLTVMTASLFLFKRSIVLLWRRSTSGLALITKLTDLFHQLGFVIGNKAALYKLNHSCGVNGKLSTVCILCLSAPAPLIKVRIS